MSEIVFMLLVVMIMLFLIGGIMHSNAEIWADQPFECGVSTLVSSRKPYSTFFFFLSIVFLFFDVEIMLVFPLVFSEKSSSIYMIVTILLGGLFMEWSMGSIKWI